MKNYRFVIPVLIILAFVGSIFYLYNTREEKEIQYNEYLKMARENRKNDIPAVAEEYYLMALNMKDSIELRVEIGEYYFENNKKTAIDWGYQLIDNYSNNAKAYEYMADVLIKTEDYFAFYNIYDKMSRKKIKSKKVDKLRDKVEYNYYISNGEYTMVGAFGDGVCPVKGETKWGFVDEKDKKIVGIKYPYVGSFINGLAPVIDDEGKAYYIDKSGNKKKIVENMKNIETLGSLEGDKLTLYDGASWGIYTDKGRKIIDGFDNMSSAINGYVAAEKNHRWQIYDLDGKLINEEKYNDVKQDEKGVIFRNDRMFVKIADDYYMIDNKGNKITETKYESADVFRIGELAAVKVDGKWGFINNKGEMIIEPKYDGARSFNNGYAAVKLEDKWGFIDTDGNMVIKPAFDDAKDFTTTETVFVRIYNNWSMLLLYRTNH